jgi:hypothetical protein
LQILSLYKGKNSRLTHAWQRVGRPLTKVKGQHVVTLHFYAAVAKGYRSPLYFTAHYSQGKGAGRKAASFKGHHFVDIVKKLMRDLRRSKLARKPFFIIRDRASQHTCPATVEALTLMGVPVLDSFPAQSFDLNMIENVWAQLAQRMKARNPRTAVGFKRAAQEEWKGIKQSTIDGIVAKVPARLLKIKEREGAWLGKYNVGP